MHPFSIDFITREPVTEDDANGNVNVNSYRAYQRQYSMHSDASDVDVSKHHREEYRHTPSPTDSGMESDNSPHHTESPDSIAETLLSLDKQATRITKPPCVATNPLPPRPEASDDKPSHSYIALISMAILSRPERKMLLCDIYQYIMETFAYYNNDEKAWRNSIRHNLSLNECFVKNGRADNGKGNYWSIHPACEEDFAKGDFRRRQARRRARKSIKECGSPDMPMSFRYNVGYVPMTASHIGYHPYGSPAAAASLLYQQQASSYPAFTSPQTSSTHSLTSRSAQLSSSLTQQGFASSGYMTSQMPPMTSSMTSPTLSSANAAAAAHRLFSEQSSGVYGPQGIPSNHVASGIQFQNW